MNDTPNADIEVLVEAASAAVEKAWTVGYRAGASGVLTTVAVLADKWWDEDSSIEHVVACQDYGCKDCVVIACATDLRALLAEWRIPPEGDAR